MKVIKQNVTILNHSKEISKNNKDLIELAGRTCYKSQLNKNTQLSFIQQLIKSGHESVIEHISVSFLITTNRAISHEIVRHRLASYSQESTRYCNYSKNKFSNELTFILPNYIGDKLKFIDNDYLEYENFNNSELIKKVIEYRFSDNSEINSYGKDFFDWLKICETAEEHYLQKIEEGVTPEWARGILPNDLKTEILVTMNLRQWRHFLILRQASAAHPQIRELAISIKEKLKIYYPEVFFDI